MEGYLSSRIWAVGNAEVSRFVKTTRSFNFYHRNAGRRRGGGRVKLLRQWLFVLSKFSKQ